MLRLRNRITPGRAIEFSVLTSAFPIAIDEETTSLALRAVLDMARREGVEHL